MFLSSSSTFIALMCTVTQTPLHKPMNYRIHLTSGKCVSHKHYSLHPFRLSERGCSETYTKRVKYHFLFKDYLLHTTSENAQQSPSFQSLHKISWKEFQKVKKGTNWLLLFTFFHKYGSICNQHFNTRHELLQKQKY